ncbi:MAG TPA: cupredoxin domain-containing protein [Burkholderiales bacterium]|nr:cupredoxin domain-containing protein [Burkholderiales bacterium]
MFAPLAFAQDHGGHGRPKETSFGRPADANKASRVVRVEMSDQMRFTPAQITVKQGEIVRFELVNKGQVMHEMVLGTLDDLKKHAELMKKNPGMPHDAPHMAHVAPGKSGTIGWQFTKPGEFFYACLVAGHFEAGMIGKVTVQSGRAGDIKALSSEEVEQYLSGAGMGYAKAAELNRHPGPMHVLELADQLKLSPEQRTATAKLMEAHKDEARKIGARLVAAERALDELFRSGAVAGDTLAQAVARTAVLQGEYRLTHLETHRRMRTLLSDAQVARYDALRGYAAR